MLMFVNSWRLYLLLPLKLFQKTAAGTDLILRILKRYMPHAEDFVRFKFDSEPFAPLKDSVKAILHKSYDKVRDQAKER